MHEQATIAKARQPAAPTAVPRAAARAPLASADGHADRHSGVAPPRLDRLGGLLARSVRERILARWRTVPSGTYTAASPHGAIGSAFTSQEESITLQPRPGGAPGRGIRYVQHTPAAPDLLASADNTIAMQDTAGAGQAKEVYLHPAVRATANAVLANKNSPIKLGRAGHTITLNAHGAVPQHTLEKVRPQWRKARAGAAQLNADDFPKLAAVICRDVAESILGGQLTHIRMRDPSGGVRDVAASTADANIVTGSQQLAEAVARGKISLATAATKMAVQKVPQPSKKYGKATLQQRFGARAANIGINENAWARTGEAYVIQSTYGKNGDNRNWSDPTHPAVVGGFGYHFAAVVAEAADHRDAVTLENYRRTSEVDAAAVALLNDLRVRFAHQLAAALSRAGAVALRPAEEIGAILAYVETNSATDFNQAYQKWQQIVAEGITPGALWYFRMVGRDDPDQSFHRQCASSGWYVSPITFVMAN